tara:strand:+ start:8263 stop:8592 length:330 start_codon:yes stop_codon:yes gene_type:complete
VAEFQSQIEKFSEERVDIYGVSADPVSALLKFSDKHNIEYSLLSDLEKELISQFGVWGKKKLYGKEYEGIFRSTAILDGKNVVTHVFPKVSPKGHADQVLEILRDFGYS